MQFTTGFLDSLFGEKLTIELPGPNGAVLKRTVTKKWLEQMQRQGKVVQITRPTVAVHVLTPTGYRLQHWTIGEDVDDQTCEEFRDAATNALYVMTVFKAGEPTNYFLKKDAWDQAKEQMDEVGRPWDTPHRPD